MLQSCLFVSFQLLKIGPALKELKEKRDERIASKLCFDLRRHFLTVGQWKIIDNCLTLLSSE